jgi:hypothetical protein
VVVGVFEPQNRCGAWTREKVGSPTLRRNGEHGEHTQVRGKKELEQQSKRE